MTRFVDRGAITAAYVGIGMALTIGVSFLLVIPIDPVYWLFALPAGLLIGYYANTRSERRGGPWGRILANAVVAGLATGLVMAGLLLAVKGIFFVADDGYRDPGLGGRIECQAGGDCVYRRYLEQQGDALAAAGVNDADSFARFYWAQQWSTAGTVLGLTVLGGVGGGALFRLAQPRSTRADGIVPPLG